MWILSCMLMLGYARFEDKKQRGHWWRVVGGFPWLGSALQIPLQYCDSFWLGTEMPDVLDCIILAPSIPKGSVLGTHPNLERFQKWRLVEQKLKKLVANVHLVIFTSLSKRSVKHCHLCSSMEDCVQSLYPMWRLFGMSVTCLNGFLSGKSAVNVSSKTTKLMAPWLCERKHRKYEGSCHCNNFACITDARSDICFVIDICCSMIIFTHATPAFICLSICLAAWYLKKPLQLDLTYKCSTMSPGKPFRVRGEGHEAQKQCRRGFCTLVSASFFYLLPILKDASHY